MTGNGREIADRMERRKVEILCIQETRWRGNKARELGGGFKLFYSGADDRGRNGVGIVLISDDKENIINVTRKNDRIIAVRLIIGEMIVNVISAYAPQVGGDEDEKDRFWQDLDRVWEGIPNEERIVVAGDLNGHVGMNNMAIEGVHGGHGHGIVNNEGERIIDFEVASDMAILNTFYDKNDYTTYSSGQQDTQLDYILYKRNNMNEVIRQAGEDIFGKTSGKGPPNDKETWWWNEEVAECIKEKKEAKKSYYRNRNDANRERLKLANKAAKKAVAIATAEAREDAYEELETMDGQKKIFRIAKARDRQTKDHTHIRHMKDENGRILYDDDDDVTRRWKGSALSPYIFDLIMDVLSEGIRRVTPWTMLFADDIVLVCKTKAELKRELSRWRRALEDRGFKISRTKTEYLQFNDNEDDEEMRMDDESIKRVAAFKY
ncbi:hypothetical protein Pmani_027812 [Petrolisthes manimaculis]|uniref:Reverse transcriptase domain-containing protein n=1 Tax=Petrolisthes manimaculis TaxID=1843537 RepID=A0AAE1TW51_9EUCA|nr:hypothetical protein Pmani_027812 [Petrolisthes manimaculis]